MKQEFEMTQEEYEHLKKIECQPIVSVLGTEPIIGNQDGVDKAWKEMGDKHGFIWYSVERSDKGRNWFKATPTNNQQ
jgi:hypothetical protein